MSKEASIDSNDLWGPPFQSLPADFAPARLLREQAQVLTTRTGGRIVGVEATDIDKGTVWASLYVKVPALKGYMYKMLTIAHPVVDDPNDPKRLTVHDTFRGGDDWHEVESMNQLTSWLREALSSDQAHAVVSNLLKYAPESVTA